MSIRLALVAALMIAACQGTGPSFAVLQTRLNPGERLVLRTNATNEVWMTPGYGGAPESVPVTNGRVTWEWPAHPGLLMLQFATAKETTLLLLRVAAHGQQRDVNIVAQSTNRTLSASDRKLWRSFCSGLLDDDVRRAVDLRMSSWFGKNANERLLFAFVLDQSWQPFALAFGPGAHSLTPSTLWSLYGVLIDAAVGLEYSALETEIGFMSKQDGERLRQLVRRITVVVDGDAAVRGLPRDSVGRLLPGPGHANIAGVANWAQEVLLERDFPFAIEECGADARFQTALLVRAAAR